MTFGSEPKMDFNLSPAAAAIKRAHSSEVYFILPNNIGEKGKFLAIRSRLPYLGSRVFGSRPWPSIWQRHSLIPHSSKVYLGAARQITAMRPPGLTYYAESTMPRSCDAAWSWFIVLCVNWLIETTIFSSADHSRLCPTEVKGSATCVTLTRVI